MQQEPGELSPSETSAGGISRRRFIGYLISAPTLVAAAGFESTTAEAALPTVQIPDAYDLLDAIRDAALPTANLIKIVMHTDGTASFELPRAEVGQGLTTSIAMIIADELDLPISKVSVTLADARPELAFNQLTGGSSSIFTMFQPVRVAAAVARSQLLKAAALLLNEYVGALVVKDGMVRTRDGRTVSYGQLAVAAASQTTTPISVSLKPTSQMNLVGKPQGRRDAMAIVTGRKIFAMDLDIPNALPTMICRSPTINGVALAINNVSVVSSMPGVTDVAIVPRTKFVPGGVAVRAKTFGQCIDAIRVLSVNWGPGTADDLSDADVLAKLKAAELPLAPPLLSGLLNTQTNEETFTFHFRSGDPLEPNCAVADVRSDRAEIWSCLKTPLWVQEQLSLNLGLPVGKIVMHITEGGGSFGRHLFGDAAFEAAAVSRIFNKPVKLMWHRTDTLRLGRVHPMTTSRVRITYSGYKVLALDQRHTCVATDFTHGFGELLTATGATLPKSNLAYSQLIFHLTASCPYNFGPVTQALNEVYAYNTFHTSSVRAIYTPDVVTAMELMVDKQALITGQDPYQFRRSFARDNRLIAVLDKVAQVGNWGRTMAPGTAQGMAMYSEYKGRAACLVEIDTTPAQVNRTIRSAYTGPRVTKVVIAIDVGLPINPLGLEAQMLGGVMDGIAQALSFSLHLQNGRFAEGSWDQAYYTRQWNVPPEVQVIVMPATTGEPGGAGELGVPAAMAAVACAYARAVGKMPTSFPINHGDGPLFTPFPTVPPIPQSPTDGLTRTYY